MPRTLLRRQRDQIIVEPDHLGGDQMGNGERNRQLPRPAVALAPHGQHPGRPTTVDPLCAQSSRLTLPYGRALRLPASSFWLLSQFVSTVAVLSGPPCAAFMRYLLIDTSSDDGCRLKRAENFSWSGMSSAVRRLTQGALAPNPHTPVIQCMSGHHDRFACFLCETPAFP